MESVEREAYRVCAERNSAEAFRHFLDRAYPRFADPEITSWRARLRARIWLFYRGARGAADT